MDEPFSTKNVEETRCHRLFYVTEHVVFLFLIYRIYGEYTKMVEIKKDFRNQIKTSSYI